MKQLLFLVIIFIGQNLHAQFREQPEEETYTKVEVIPEYPGGMGAFYAYLGKNIQYPEDARKLAIQGRVYIQFEIQRDGYVDTASVKTVRGLMGSMNREAERVIKSMPQWVPGRISEEGEAVRVRMVLPVIYNLSDGKPQRKKKKKEN